jgi:hemerythrin superfamily protein
MKATNLLKRQHRLTERLFRQLQKTKEEGERAELLTQLADALSAHMAIEEQIFYPAAQQVLTGKKALMGETAYLEHMSGKAALQNLLGDGPMSFEARLKVLKELVLHHVEEEEQQLFPEIESLMDDAQLKELGAQLQEAHAQLEALGHEGIMAQDMQAAAAEESGQAAEATSSESNDQEAASKSRANGASGRGASKSSGRSQARA